MAELVGWSVLDVRDFVAIAQPPPDHFLVVSGTFDGDTLDTELAEVEDGIVTDVEGDDHEINVDAPSALDRLGAPTRLAEQDGRIAAASSTEAVRGWLDGEESLADDDAFADVAAALDGQRVYSAVLSPAPSGLDPAMLVLGGQASPDQVQELQERLDGQLPDDAYDAVGIGWAADDDGPLVSFAYHFDSEDQAEDNVDALRTLYESGTSLTTNRPYSDYFEVDDVTTAGPAVVVNARPASDTPLGAAYEMLNTRELLFVSR
jgi:hypothetical protein